MRVKSVIVIVFSWLSVMSSAASADKITAAIQRDLNILGYNAGPVDGVSGRKTVSRA